MRRLLSIALLLLSAPLSAEPWLYGIYSNLSASDGEPSGMEMFFLHDGRPGRCSDSVLFQVAEGWPQYPELLDCCGCSANHIEFKSKKWGRFVGRIDGDTLKGLFVDANHSISLKRGFSYWQQAAPSPH